MKTNWRNLALGLVVLVVVAVAAAICTEVVIDALGLEVRSGVRALIGLPIGGLTVLLMLRRFPVVRFE